MGLFPWVLVSIEWAMERKTNLFISKARSEVK